MEEIGTAIAGQSLYIYMLYSLIRDNVLKLYIVHATCYEKTTKLHALKVLKRILYELLSLISQ
jgi:hypothetical protein